jgi:hypothetical protein
VGRPLPEAARLARTGRGGGVTVHANRSPAESRMKARNTAVKLLFPDRVLQQELLLALQFGDVERPGQAALQPSAEKLRREGIGAGDIDLGDASLDRPQRDDAVLDILVGDRGPGIDVAAIDVKQGQGAAQLFQAGDRGRWPTNGETTWRIEASSSTLLPSSLTPRSTKIGAAENGRSEPGAGGAAMLGCGGSAGSWVAGRAPRRCRAGSPGRRAAGTRHSVPPPPLRSAKTKRSVSAPEAGRILSFA